MMIRTLVAIAALLLPAHVLAQDLEGHWALRIDDANIFVFALEQGEDGQWQGTWTRPAEIDSNGAVFRRMAGSETIAPTDVQASQDMVRMTFAGPPGTQGTDVLRIALVAENQARLVYQGIPGDPYPLIRVGTNADLGPFDETRIYDRDNAVTEAEFVPEAEPEEDEARADEEEETQRPRLTADFLDGL